MEQKNRLIKNAVKGRRGAFEELIRLHQDDRVKMQDMEYAKQCAVFAYELELSEN